jgi:xanthine dehydrogenase YagT iron-sulfur-binding subunit
MKRDEIADGVSRRTVLQTAAAATAIVTLSDRLWAEETEATPTEKLILTVNRRQQVLNLDPRTTLLDALREHLALTGTKKGCDQGQCGACTVLVNGRRINSCLTLAVMHAGDEITTIEGLANGDDLHPMQAAFVRHDGLQCGYCTPGQICSAVALLAEHKAGWPSHVTADVATTPALTDAEIAERMSGNICRCAAYANIVAAIRGVAEGGRT